MFLKFDSRSGVYIYFQGHPCPPDWDNTSARGLSNSCLSFNTKLFIMVRNTLFTTTLLGVAASFVDAACTPKGSSASSGSGASSGSSSSSGSSGVTSVSNASNSSGSGLVASTYFAGYHIDDGYPVSSIQWDKYNEVVYAFA